MAHTFDLPSWSTETPRSTGLSNKAVDDAETWLLTGAERDKLEIIYKLKKNEEYVLAPQAYQQEGKKIP